MTAWYVGLLALILAAVGAFVVVRLRDDLTQASDRHLRAASAQIATSYEAEGVLEFRDSSRAVLSGERPAAQVVEPSGAVVAAFGDPIAQAPMLAPGALSAARGPTAPATRRFDARAPWRVVARPVLRQGRREVVVAAVSLGPVDRSVHRVLVLLLVALPAALLATAAGGWWLARRALRPVELMTTAAERIGGHRLRERLDVPATRDELRRLADTLNTMLDRIEAGVSEQQRLVADTSHELRTPLAAMRSEIDVSLRADRLEPPAQEVLKSVREEVDRMSATVDDLLTLAAADARRASTAPRVAVDLREQAEAVAAALRPLAARHGAAVAVTGERVVVTGDPQRLRQAMRNLVDNALKFGPDGGAVTVRVWSAGDRAGVTVEDEGPGVPPEHAARVFDRFYRADPSRTRATGGSGLGLAIVREVAHAHGGEVRLHPRTPRGSAFELSLPV